MKRILIILIAFILILATACEKATDYFEEIEFIESPTNSISEADVDEIKLVAELNLTVIEEWSSKNKIGKAILLGEDGYYYNVVKGGDASPEFDFCFDNGNGQPKPLPMYIDIFRGDVLYGGDHSTLCKYEKGHKKSLNVNAFFRYYTEEYIYFTYYDWKEAKVENAIYRMNYNGKNITPLVKIGEEDNFDYFVVYNNKIWYRYYHEREFLFACYDLSSEETLQFDRGGIGLINNGYMYCIEYDNEEQRNRLYRFNLETYSVELVCNANVQNFDFCGDYIIYMAEDENNCSIDTLYKMNLTENKKILSADQLGHSDKIFGFDCEGNRIFVDGGIYFYNYIAEIDIGGNLVKTIHENEFYYRDE